AARQAALAGQISALGGDPATVGRAVATAGVDVTALHHAPARDGSRLLLGLLAGGLIYISLLIFGPAVAQSVIEEKTSRVVELLLAVIRPWQLMAGKVLGIGVVALGQLVLIGVVGVGLGLATGDLGIPTGIAVGSVAAALLWYLIGFAMYALMFAAAGALVSRQEDAGGVTAPMISMIIIPYVLGISVLPSTPDSGLIGALAIVPLFAPILMPMVIGSLAGAGRAGAVPGVDRGAGLVGRAGVRQRGEAFGDAGAAARSSARRLSPPSARCALPARRRRAGIGSIRSNRLGRRPCGRRPGQR
uniref:ABC transporter permease n=1 Tax=Candidatus Frankia alpina TaxID=2699483 RepID=UPI001F392197